MTEKRYSVKFDDYDAVEVKASSAAKAKARLWRNYDDAYPGHTDFFQFVRRCTAALAAHEQGSGKEA